MSEATFTVKQAAQACGVSARTIMRRLADGGLVAYKDERDAWQIPVSALIAAGFAVGKPSDPDPSTPAPGEPTVNELRAQIALLEARLDGAERLRQAAERNADDLRQALRMLEAGPKPEPDVLTVAERAELDQALRDADRPRRRWWQAGR